MEPLQKQVGRSSPVKPRGRVLLPPEWIGNDVLVAPSDTYVAIPKGEFQLLETSCRNLSLAKRLFEDVLNSRSNGRKMFNIVTKTWNPVTGCLHFCKYCWARGLAMTKLKNSHRYREGFKPSLNATEFKVTFKKGDFVFVSDMGDLFGDFIPRQWIMKVINRTRLFPQAFFLFLTKNPQRYKEFLDVIPENVILGATIETNRDRLFVESAVSRAPLPTRRYRAMKDLDWDKKFISIEPIMDFDFEIFNVWIREIAPFMMYVGYDNYDNRLPEPPLRRTEKLLKEASKISLVVRKKIRSAWSEGLGEYSDEDKEKATSRMDA